MNIRKSSRVWILLMMGALTILSAVIFLPPFRTSRALPEVAASELTLRDGRSYRQNETLPFTGIMTETYSNGSVKSRSVLSNGVLHGVSEGWYTNGTLQVREHFQKGISHGIRTKWFANGSKMSEAAVENGKIQGLFRRWHENGQLAEEIQMTNNVPDGISRAFYPSGALEAQARLEKGKVIDQRFWKEGEAPAVAASGTAH